MKDFTSDSAPTLQAVIHFPCSARVADAIQVSKLRWRLVDDSLKPLSLEEAFYMATMGGGAFFGKVGSFLEGYEFDALILDDSSLRHPQPPDLHANGWSD